MYSKKSMIGVNDSAKAKKHFSQEIFFEKNAEAERVVEFFNAHYGFSMKLSWAKFKGGTMGEAYYETQHIRLMVGGDSMATLLHEIGHIVDFYKQGHMGHGAIFHKAQDEVIGVFDLNAHKLILGSKPTMAYHAAEVVALAASAGREIEDMLNGYAAIEEIDAAQLLDAVCEII